MLSVNGTYLEESKAELKLLDYWNLDEDQIAAIKGAVTAI